MVKVTDEDRQKIRSWAWSLPSSSLLELYRRNIKWSETAAYKHAPVIAQVLGEIILERMNS